MGKFVIKENPHHAAGVDDEGYLKGLLETAK
jgi:hypothetical protein